MGGRGFVAGAVEATLFELSENATNYYKKDKKCCVEETPDGLSHRESPPHREKILSLDFLCLLSCIKTRK